MSANASLSKLPHILGVSLLTSALTAGTIVNVYTGPSPTTSDSPPTSVTIRLSPHPSPPTTKNTHTHYTLPSTSPLLLSTLKTLPPTTSITFETFPLPSSPWLHPTPSPPHLKILHPKTLTINLSVKAEGSDINIPLDDALKCHIKLYLITLNDNSANVIATASSNSNPLLNLIDTLGSHTIALSTYTLSTLKASTLKTLEISSNGLKSLGNGTRDLVKGGASGLGDFGVVVKNVTVSGCRSMHNGFKYGVVVSYNVSKNGIVGFNCLIKSLIPKGIPKSKKIAVLTDSKLIGVWISTQCECDINPKDLEGYKGYITMCESDTTSYSLYPKKGLVFFKEKFWRDVVEGRVVTREEVGGEIFEMVRGMEGEGVEEECRRRVDPREI